MRTHCVFTVVVLSTALVQGEALGQATFVLASRILSVFSAGGGPPNDPDQSESYSSSEFGTFRHSISVSTLNGGSSASQYSTLSPDQIFVQSGASGGGINISRHHAQSDFGVVFTLAQPTPYAFRGGVYYGTAELFGEGRRWAYLSTQTGADNLEIYGVLPAGSYTLTASCWGFNTSGDDDVTGSVGIVLTIPSPASIVVAGLLPLALRRRRRSAST